MKVLVVGGGGREHALAWKMSGSPLVGSVCCAPGNAGTAQVGRNVPIEASDIEALLSFAVKEGVDLTVVGPEAPLTMGIVDRFQEKGLRIFGPAASAARLEGSKVFAKGMMMRCGVPTAPFEVFKSPDEAERHVGKRGCPMVVKADGLAAGKGVVVCRSRDGAMGAVRMIMRERAFGDAGSRVVIEDCLQGEEASFLAFVDGETVVPMVSSQDHKAVYDGDRGPNTGGMGAYSPAPVVTPEVERRIMERVMRPLVRGLAREGIVYRGVLYVGIMIVDGEPMVLEFNVRFGDPEAQPILVRLESDLVPILEGVIDGRLKGMDVRWRENASVCVVMASGGYPGSYKKGMVIRGLEEAERMKDVAVFHAGTSMEGGEIVTSGGRVLGVTAWDDTIRGAIEKAYRAVEAISWDGAYCRRDIGHRALSYLSG